MEENEDVFYQFDNRLTLGASLGKKCYIGTIDNSESTCLFKKTEDGYHYERILDGVNRIEYLGEGVYHIQDINCKRSVLCLNDFETIIDFSDLPLARRVYYWPNYGDGFGDIPKHFSTIRIEHVEHPTPMDCGHCYLIGISGGRKYYGFLTISEKEDGTLWYSLDVPIGYDKIVYGDFYVYAEKGQYRHLYCRVDAKNEGIPRYIEFKGLIQGLQGDIDLERIDAPFTRVGEEPYPICNRKTLLCNYYSYRFQLRDHPIEADSVTRLCVLGDVCINYYVFKIGQLYGLWQHDHGVILRCEYNEIQAYLTNDEHGEKRWYGDVLLVRRGNKWGIFSIEKERMIVPPLFDRVLSLAHNDFGKYIGFYTLLDNTKMLIETNGDIRITDDNSE